ncbi:MAG TPA: hypothetical protein VFU16_09850 [Solirubrobacterales bacterium]|nr:hypothetical protein [Solirubrobacterales bacterium]
MIRLVKDGSWAERVAAVRSVPAEFPGKELSSVYAELARECYVPNLAPHFHIVPWPERFLDRDCFLEAYEAAATFTDDFSSTSGDRIAAAIRQDPRSLRIFRLIIGYTPKELSEVVRSFAGASLPVDSLEDGGALSKKVDEALPAIGLLISQLVTGEGGYEVSDELRERGFLSKTDKPDTDGGWGQVAKFARNGVPYSELLYQRWYGGAFRQLQDAGGRFKGDLLEDATEILFKEHRVPFVRTGSAPSVSVAEDLGVTVQPAPDFILHDGQVARGLLECKSTGDGGTARDKADRFFKLRREAARLGGIPVLAVLEGLGWRRLNDALGPVVRDCDGRVFTPATLAELLYVDPVRDLIGLAD